MKALPPLTPELQQKVDQFHAGCAEMLDRYIAGVEIDMNRHAIKHGPMPEGRAVFDLTRILAQQVRQGDLQVNMLCGMLSLAVTRGIAKKRQGKGGV